MTRLRQYKLIPWFQSWFALLPAAKSLVALTLDRTLIRPYDIGIIEIRAGPLKMLHFAGITGIIHCLKTSIPVELDYGEQSSC